MNITKFVNLKVCAVAAFSCAATVGVQHWCTSDPADDVPPKVQEERNEKQKKIEFEIQQLSNKLIEKERELKATKEAIAKEKAELAEMDAALRATQRTGTVALSEENTVAAAAIEKGGSKVIEPAIVKVIHPDPVVPPTDYVPRRPQVFDGGNREPVVPKDTTIGVTRPLYFSDSSFATDDSRYDPAIPRRGDALQHPVNIFKRRRFVDLKPQHVASLKIAKDGWSLETLDGVSNGAYAPATGTERVIDSTAARAPKDHKKDDAAVVTLYGSGDPKPPFDGKSAVSEAERNAFNQERRNFEEQQKDFELKKSKKEKELADKEKDLEVRKKFLELREENKDDAADLFDLEEPRVVIGRAENFNIPRREKEPYAINRQNDKGMTIKAKSKDPNIIQSNSDFKITGKKQPFRNLEKGNGELFVSGKEKGTLSIEEGDRLTVLSKEKAPYQKQIITSINLCDKEREKTQIENIDPINLAHEEPKNEISNAESIEILQKKEKPLFASTKTAAVEVKATKKQPPKLEISKMQPITAEAQAVETKESATGTQKPELSVTSKTAEVSFEKNTLPKKDFTINAQSKLFVAPKKTVKKDANVETEPSKLEISETKTLTAEAKKVEKQEIGTEMGASTSSVITEESSFGYSPKIQAKPLSLQRNDSVLLTGAKSFGELQEDVVEKSMHIPAKSKPTLEIDKKRESLLFEAQPKPESEISSVETLSILRQPKPENQISSEVSVKVLPKPKPVYVKMNSDSLSIEGNDANWRLQTELEATKEELKAEKEASGLLATELELEKTLQQAGKARTFDALKPTKAFSESVIRTKNTRNTEVHTADKVPLSTEKNELFIKGEKPSKDWIIDFDEDDFNVTDLPEAKKSKEKLEKKKDEIAKESEKSKEKWNEYFQSMQEQGSSAQNSFQKEQALKEEKLRSILAAIKNESCESKQLRDIKQETTERIGVIKEPVSTSGISIQTDLETKDRNVGTEDLPRTFDNDKMQRVQRVNESFVNDKLSLMSRFKQKEKEYEKLENDHTELCENAEEMIKLNEEYVSENKGLKSTQKNLEEELVNLRKNYENLKKAFEELKEVEETGCCNVSDECEIKRALKGAREIAAEAMEGIKDGNLRGEKANELLKRFGEQARCFSEGVGENHINHKCKNAVCQQRIKFMNSLAHLLQKMKNMAPFKAIQAERWMIKGSKTSKPFKVTSVNSFKLDVDPKVKSETETQKEQLSRLTAENEELKSRLQEALVMQEELVSIIEKTKDGEEPLEKENNDLKEKLEELEKQNKEKDEKLKKLEEEDEKPSELFYTAYSDNDKLRKELEEKNNEINVQKQQYRTLREEMEKIRQEKDNEINAQKRENRDLGDENFLLEFENKVLKDRPKNEGDEKKNSKDKKFKKLPKKPTDPGIAKEVNVFLENLKKAGDNLKKLELLRKELETKPRLKEWVSDELKEAIKDAKEHEEREEKYKKEEEEAKKETNELKQKLKDAKNVKQLKQVIMAFLDNAERRLNIAAKEFEDMESFVKGIEDAYGSDSEQARTIAQKNASGSFVHTVSALQKNVIEAWKKITVILKPKALPGKVLEEVTADEEEKKINREAERRKRAVVQEKDAEIAALKKKLEEMERKLKKQVLDAKTRRHIKGKTETNLLHETNVSPLYKFNDTSDVRDKKKRDDDRRSTQYETPGTSKLRNRCANNYSRDDSRRSSASHSQTLLKEFENSGSRLENYNESQIKSDKTFETLDTKGLQSFTAQGKSANFLGSIEEMKDEIQEDDKEYMLPKLRKAGQQVLNYLNSDYWKNDVMWDRNFETQNKSVEEALRSLLEYIEKKNKRTPVLQKSVTEKKLKTTKAGTKTRSRFLLPTTVTDISTENKSGLTKNLKSMFDNQKSDGKGKDTGTHYKKIDPKNLSGKRKLNYK